VETAFNIFDVTGDGEVEAKVCCLHVAAQNRELCQIFSALAHDKKILKSFNSQAECLIYAENTVIFTVNLNDATFLAKNVLKIRLHSVFSVLGELCYLF
jgi:hypothetical protein